MPFRDAITLADDRLLIDTGILVRSLELCQRVDVRPDLAREVTVFSGFDANNDAFGIDRIDDSVSAADHHSSGVAGRDLFHTGSDQRSSGPEQRHGLALHVGSHQDRKSTRLNSSHLVISYAVFCLKKKKKKNTNNNYKKKKKKKKK